MKITGLSPFCSIRYNQTSVTLIRGRAIASSRAVTTARPASRNHREGKRSVSDGERLTGAAPDGGLDPGTEHLGWALDKKARPIIFSYKEDLGSDLHAYRVAFATILVHDHPHAGCFAPNESGGQAAGYSPISPTGITGVHEQRNESNLLRPAASVPFHRNGCETVELE